MSAWYRRICADYSEIPEFIAEYEKNISGIQSDLQMGGITLEQHASKMPGITEACFGQLQEVEAVLEYMNLDLKKIRSKKFKHFTHNYEKALTSRDAEKYIDGDDEVFAQAVLINDIALLRNKYLSLSKGLDVKHWQIANVVKLRCAGLEDANIR